MNLKKSAIEIQSAWENAEPIIGLNSDTWRMDFLGNLILRKDYGFEASVYGWDISKEGIPMSNSQKPIMLTIKMMVA